jgi:hypothetical protein
MRSNRQVTTARAYSTGVAVAAFPMQFALTTFESGDQSGDSNAAGKALVSFALPSGATTCVAAAEPTLGRRAANLLLCRRAASSQLLKGEPVLVSRSVPNSVSLPFITSCTPALGISRSLQCSWSGHVTTLCPTHCKQISRPHAAGRPSQQTSGGSTSSSGCCRRSLLRSRCAPSAWASSLALQRRPHAAPAQGAPPIMHPVCPLCSTAMFRPYHWF